MAEAKKQAAAEIAALIELMAALRQPETGCPWDIAQNFASIAPYTIEEAYEVADAIARGNRADLCEELGDLLLQVIFHARMAEEEGSFNFADVARGLRGKLIRRHPHIFGPPEQRAAAADPAAVSQIWQNVKQQERAARSARSGAGNAAAAEKAESESRLSAVSPALPPVLETKKLQQAAERVGFDWAEPQPVIDKMREELTELEEALAAGDKTAIGKEYGDILFTAVNLGRKIQADFELSLKGANQKFRRRFGYIEQELRRAGEAPKPENLARMENLWNEAKQQEG